MANDELYNPVARSEPRASASSKTTAAGACVPAAWVGGGQRMGHGGASMEGEGDSLMG